VILDAPGQIVIRDVPAPRPAPGRPLIRIRSAGICGSDVNSFLGKGQALGLPLTLGHEAAGEVVETVGDSRFRPGDAVIIEPYLYCGSCYPCSRGQRNCCEHLQCLGVHTDGTMSEYVTHPEDLLHRKPEGMPWAYAAFVEPLTIATHGVHRVQAVAGEHAVVIGAGTIGVLTALYLKHLGVIPILVDILESRLKAARGLGIGHTILSDGSAPVDEVKEITQGRGAETVFEISGSARGVENTVHLASYTGRISLTGWPSKLPTIETPLITRRELIIYGSRDSAGEFPEAIELIDSGAIDAANIITKIIGFDELPDEIRRIADDPSDTLKTIALV
jgi:threonine dehydrogenase-like Zn-dependent dehydrogenase